MKIKALLILGVIVTISLVQCVPLDEENNELTVEDGGNEIEKNDNGVTLTEDEITNKINQIQAKFEQDFLDLNNRAEENRKKLKEEQDKIEKEYEPLMAKFDEIRWKSEEKLKTLKYYELKDAKQTIEQDSKELLKKAGILDDEFREVKDDYLRKKKKCLEREFVENTVFDRFVEDNDCNTKLPELKDRADKVSEKLAQALDGIKTKHQEAKDVYDKIEAIDEEMGKWIKELFENEKDSLIKLEQLSDKGIELMRKGLDKKKELGKDTQILKDNARKEIRKLLPNLTLQWVKWNRRQRNLPANSIRAGVDIDKSVLYIARRKNLYGVDYEYGKCTDSRDCFVTNSRGERGAFYVDILTGDNFTWCKGTGKDIINDEFPICRANHEDSITPGTLLSNGKCRIGFGWDIFDHEDFEVLKQGSC